MRNLKLGFILLIVWSCNRPNTKNATEINGTRDTLVVLKNDSVTLKVSRFGGAIVSFAFNDQQLNPLDWKLAVQDMPANNKKGAPFQGHFLCIGRWGSPTEGEKAVGIPHNGEPSNSWWEDTLLQKNSVAMETIAPLEQWKVQRKIVLSKAFNCFEVEETLSNLQNCGRFTVIVQHASMGGNFLSKETIINSNAAAGFNQALASKSLTDYEYKWPVGYIDSSKTTIDLTRSETKTGFVTTHIIDGEIGWATATSPGKHLLIGYVWKTADYPWLHIWHGLKNGELWAKGIEFGTTGIGDTYSPEKRAVLTFHGRNNNLFIDAKASVTKKYTCFLIRIPEDFVKTTSVEYADNKIKVNFQTHKKSYTNHVN